MDFGDYVSMRIEHVKVGFLQMDHTVLLFTIVLIKREVLVRKNSLLSASIVRCFLVGINAWQAIEIVFLFLATSALLFTIVSFICYRFRQSIHYYLAILAAFCAWPAGNSFMNIEFRSRRFLSTACVGISGLFVFGFSVYNVAQTPRNLDWCFYVNIVAVILCIIGAIVLTIYGILLKRPTKTKANDSIIETFTDLNGYPTTYSPSTFVVVRQDKKKRKKPYNFQQEYFPTRMMSNAPNTDYITNPNYQMLSSYNPPPPQQQQNTSPYQGPGVFTSQSATSIHRQTRYHQPPTTNYRYQPPPPHWHRTESNPINYNPEPGNDYIQRGIYRPARLNPTEFRDEPRVLHYYTGYDHFATVDPSDVILTRHHPPPHPERAAPVRYPSYYPQSDYVKSAM